MMISPTLIDLTQILVAGMPDWDGCCGFQMQTLLDYDEGACVQTLTMPNGIGTHMDAPAHFIKNGKDISAIKLEKLFCPGVVVDVSAHAHQDYLLSFDDLNAFEKKHGAIPEASIVIINTGWGRKWSKPSQYRNVNAHGIMRFPTVSIAAAEFLLQRNINGIAIDTLSPDLPDSGFGVHHKLLSAGKFIIENIKIPKNLPSNAFTIIALPLLIQSATEAPCRVMALVE